MRTKATLTLQEIKARFDEVKKYDPEFTESDVKEGVFVTAIIEYFKGKYGIDGEDADVDLLFNFSIGYQGLRAINELLIGGCNHIDYYYIEIVENLIENPTTNEILIFLYGKDTMNKVKKHIKKMKMPHLREDLTDADLTDWVDFLAQTQRSKNEN